MSKPFNYNDMKTISEIITFIVAQLENNHTVSLELSLDDFNADDIWCELNDTFNNFKLEKHMDTFYSSDRTPIHKNKLKITVYNGNY